MRRERAVGRAATQPAEKEAWVSRVLLEWGSCGRVRTSTTWRRLRGLRPGGYVPGAARFPPRRSARTRCCCRRRCVLPGTPAAGSAGCWCRRGQGPGQARRDPGRRGVRRRPGRRAETPGCVLPADYLLRVGFKTQRPHPRYPRMRLELSSAVTWRTEVEAALERLLARRAPRSGRRPPPARAAAPAVTPRSGCRVQPGGRCPRRLRGRCESQHAGRAASASGARYSRWTATTIASATTSRKAGSPSRAASPGLVR